MFSSVRITTAAFPFDGLDDAKEALGVGAIEALRATCGGNRKGGGKLPLAFDQLGGEE